MIDLWRSDNLVEFGDDMFCKEVLNTMALPITLLFGRTFSLVLIMTNQKLDPKMVT